MTTKETIDSYFDALGRKGAWTDYLDERIKFTSHVVPAKQVEGKVAFLESTKRFYSMISAVEIAGIIVEGSRACALTRYRLQVPNGPSFFTEVAEVFTVRDGKIVSIDIYFDSAPFPK